MRTASGSKEAEYNSEYEIKADFVVSCVGQLNLPQWPKIEGLDGFSGKIMHSARWDWSYDLKDKKIAVIGNGDCIQHGVYLPIVLTVLHRLHGGSNLARDREGRKAG